MIGFFDGTYGPMTTVVLSWLGLIVSIQILFWVASGLFFTLYPIEHVRSEHRVAEHAYPALDLAALPSAESLRALLPAAPAKLSYERDVRGRAVAVAEFSSGRPALIDLDARHVISPLSVEAAGEIARAAIAHLYG